MKDYIKKVEPWIRKHLKLTIFVVAIIAIAYIFFQVSMMDFWQGFMFEDFAADVQNFIEAQGVWAPVVFIGIYVIATVFLLPGSFLTASSGFLFGSFLGGLYTVIGATIGATIAFMISRKLGKGFVEKWLKAHHADKIMKYDEKIEKNGFSVMFVLRLIPLFPFNALNYLMGLTKIKRRDYIAATFVGIMPGTFIYANLGGAVGTANPADIVLAILLFGLLLLIMPGYRYVQKRRKKAQMQL